MLKKMMIIIAISILLSCIFSSCSKDVKKDLKVTTENSATTVNSTTKPNKNNINYISIDSCFLGTYENGKWNSIQLDDKNPDTKQTRDIPLNELISDKSFYTYSLTAKLGTVTKFYDKTDESNNEFGYETSHFRFAFSKETILGMSGAWNPLISKFNKVSQFTKDQKNAVRKVLDEKGLTDTAVNITLVYKADIDNDKNLEDIIIAQTPLTKDKEPIINSDDRFKNGAGVYVTAILLKNGSTIPIYFDGYKLKDLGYSEGQLPFGPDSCVQIHFYGLYDLNNDGKSEICLENWGWDVPEIRVFEYKNNIFNQVLCGQFAW